MAGVTSHKCGVGCIALERQKLEDNTGDWILVSDGVLSKSASPFSVPFEFGWNRSEYGYTTPCGIKRYTQSSIQRFLSRSRSKLSIDQFNLDLDFNCFLAENNFRDARLVTADVANGTENVPIACINEIDDMDLDPCFVYSPHRLAIGAVDLNAGVVSGCSCTDRCVDRLSCHCRLLTEEADDLAAVPVDSDQFGGYVDKRLTKVYVPGMYECNDRCSCGSRCQNRVSQEGIKAHLQVFRIRDKGWGLRCLHDLPAGYFVCLYSGQVMTNSAADEVGAERGDEYFVSLNLIEMVEDKIGYESGSEAVSSETEPDDDSLPSSVLSEGSWDPLTRDRGAKRHRSEEEEDVSRKRGKKDSSSTGDPKQGFLKVRRHLAESMRGERVSESSSDEDSVDAGFVIDAKRTGNAGRFLNHSCSPNCQLQNVFTNTHDPRFPVLAFFTTCKVSALQELTWNYLYEDGVQVFQCLCRSTRCKNKTEDQVS